VTRHGKDSKIPRNPRDIITRAGEALYGPRFQGQLAAALKVPPSRVSMMLSGDRPISAGIIQKLRDVLISEKENLRNRTSLVSVLAREIGEDFLQ
jgi:plasmid maintenance system antidote protein VapI